MLYCILYLILLYIIHTHILYITIIISYYILYYTLPSIPFPSIFFPFQSFPLIYSSDLSSALLFSYSPIPPLPLLLIPILSFLSPSQSFWFKVYVSVLGYTYLYYSQSDNSTPHVLSEWMVEVWCVEVYRVGFYVSFRFRFWAFEGLTLGVILYIISYIIIYYTYTYIIYYYYYILLYLILYSSFYSFPIYLLSLPILSSHIFFRSIFSSSLLLFSHSSSSSPSDPNPLLPLSFPILLIQSIRVGTWIYLLILFPIRQFDPACFIGVDGWGVMCWSVSGWVLCFVQV